MRNAIDIAPLWHHTGPIGGLLSLYSLAKLWNAMCPMCRILASPFGPRADG